MLLLGLTGSIATGKSTVSSLLSQPPYNIPIIDADLLARKVVEPGTPGYTAILAHFQSTTPDLLLPAEDAICGGLQQGKEGKGRPLNRPALGRRVFGDDAARKTDRAILNGIVHPAVRREIWKAMVHHLLRGTPIICLDIPLLYESQWDRYCGTILLVGVSDPSIQISRLRSRDPHLTEEDARNRVGSQGDVREKAERTVARGKGRGVVVWNDGDREDLKREVERVMRGVIGGSPAWWAWVCVLCPVVGVSSAVVALVRNWWARREWERRSGLDARAKL